MIIGIDPAYAKPHTISIFKEGQYIESVKTTFLSEILYNCRGAEMVYIEDQFFSRNAEVLKNLAQSTGKIMGVLEYSYIPYTLVRPITWQSKLKLPRKPKDISRYRWEKLHIRHIIDKASELSGQKITDEDIGAAVCIGYAMGVME